MDEIATASAADHPALVETLAQAFQSDPAMSWILPDAAHRARALRSLFRTLAANSIRYAQKPLGKTGTVPRYRDRNGLRWKFAYRGGDCPCFPVNRDSI